MHENCEMIVGHLNSNFIDASIFSAIIISIYIGLSHLWTK